MSVVEVSDLTLRIPTRVDGRAAWVHAATDVSVTLDASRIHALVGESGCGKSILAAALIGLLPPGTVSSGSVTVAGHDLSAALTQPRDPRWEPLRGKVIGSIPQSSATFLTPTRTVGAQLAETVDALSGPWAPAELLERARLSRDVLRRYPHELSGGMAGRAAVAFALAGDPLVILADEPTASLDPALRDDILGLLRECADGGTAILLITHDLASLIAGGVADEVSIMYAGRILEHGSAREVLTSPSSDYGQALLRALPAGGLHPVPGLPPSLTDLDPSTTFASRLAGAPR